MNAYASGMVELDRKVKRMVFESYGVDSEKCESFLESNNYTMRLYKYMPARKEEGEEGIGSHRDSTLFTILHQQTHGLELLNKHGQWIRVDASPSLFCVVAGDAFSVSLSQNPTAIYIFYTHILIFFLGNINLKVFIYM